MNYNKLINEITTELSIRNFFIYIIYAISFKKKNKEQLQYTAKRTNTSFKKKESKKEDIEA